MLSLSLALALAVALFLSVALCLPLAPSRSLAPLSLRPSLPAPPSHSLTHSQINILPRLLQADHLIGASGKSGLDAGGSGGEGWTSNLAPTTLPTLNKSAPGGLELDWVHGYRCHDVRNNLRYTALKKVRARTTRSLTHTYTCPCITLWSHHDLAHVNE